MTTEIKLTAAQKLAEKINKLAARINADTEAYNALVAELDAINAVEGIQAGDRVNATVGRGEKAVNLSEALVLGVQEDEGGKRIKVSVGEGFDMQVYVLTPNQVTGVVAEVAEPVGEEEVAEVQ